MCGNIVSCKSGIENKKTIELKHIENEHQQDYNHVRRKLNCIFLTIVKGSQQQISIKFNYSISAIIQDTVFTERNIHYIS